MLLTERADFGVQSEPFGIRFFFHYQLLPANNIIAVARAMDLVSTPETELLATVTLHLGKELVVRIDAVLAVGSGAEFDVVIGLYVLFTEILDVLLLVRGGVLDEGLHCGVEQNALAILLHAGDEYYLVVNAD